MNVDIGLMLRRSWWIPIVTVLIALSAALFLVTQTEPRYEASVHFLVGPSSLLEKDFDNIVDSFNPLDRQVLAITYSEILQSNRIFDNTVQAMGLTRSDFIDYTRSAVVLPQSNVVVLTVRGPDPVGATNLANYLALEGIKYAAEIYSVFDFHLLDQARVPSSPYTHNPTRSALLAMIVGGAIGVALMLGRELITLLNIPTPDDPPPPVEKQTVDQKPSETGA